jgi:exonuclease 3'-5' domain-containing protein 1
MSTTSAQSNVTFIDLEASLLPLLDSIANLAVDPPSLYIDLEGIALGRHGSISILSLYIALPKRPTLSISIVLGRPPSQPPPIAEPHWKPSWNLQPSPKSSLTSATIHALFSLLQISVDGIKDLQLMELAFRTGSRKFVSGLAKCIEKESPISTAAKTEWRLTKERCRRLFAPEKGGRYDVFNERPLKPEIIQYCKQDVALLPGLYGVYSAKLRQPGQAFWRVHVRETTKNRIKLSQRPGYDGNSKSKALG